MSTGPVVVVGAGAVGLGVLVPGLRACGAPVVAVTRTRAQATRLAYAGTAAAWCGDPGATDRLLRHARLVLVAVPPAQLAVVAPMLARGLSGRSTALDVLVCDNRVHAAASLRAVVAEHADHDLHGHGFAGALVDHIARRTGPGDSVVLAERRGAVYVDRAPLRTAFLPAPLQPVDDFAEHVVRKLHVFSAGHAAAAFLGLLRGHDRLADAVADPSVRTVVRAAMHEGRAGLVAAGGSGRGVSTADPGELDRALGRFAAPVVADTTARVARDPLRKLAAGDRIVGPALLAHAHGLDSPALAVVAAAALRAAGAASGRRDGGRSPADLWCERSGLGPRHPFVRTTLRAAQLLDAEPDPGEVYAQLRAPRDAALVVAPVAGRSQ